MLHHLTLANPTALLLLALAVPLFFLKGKTGAKHQYVFSSLFILGSLGSKPSKIFGGISFPWVIIPLIFFSIALARPQWTQSHQQIERSGVDIILAIDVSRSMLIDDFKVDGYNTERLHVAREMAKDFISKRPNDRIGIVAFAARPYQVSPVTTSHEWLPYLIDEEVVFSDLIEGGTAIGSAISTSAVPLFQFKESKTKIVILMTDGSSNKGKIDPIPAAKLAKKSGIKIYTIAIGTESGRLRNHNIQEFDTKTLEEVAAASDGKYFRAKTTESVREAFDHIDKLEKVDLPVKNYKEIHEYHQWFSLLGCVSLVLGSTILIMKPS